MVRHPYDEIASFQGERMVILFAALLSFLQLLKEEFCLVANLPLSIAIASKGYGVDKGAGG